MALTGFSATTTAARTVDQQSFGDIGGLDPLCARHDAAPRPAPTRRPVETGRSKVSVGRRTASREHRGRGASAGRRPTATTTVTVAGGARHTSALDFTAATEPPPSAPSPVARQKFQRHRSRVVACTRATHGVKCRFASQRARTAHSNCGLRPSARPERASAAVGILLEALAAPASRAGSKQPPPGTSYRW